MNNVPKPKLLFFRMDSSEIPVFVQQHLREHVNCLAQFFDLTVLDRPCDYDQVCEEHQPDLCLFESGVYASRRGITNPGAHPQIPKLGFCHCDAYCETREVFISDMAAWGVENFFTLSVSLATYTPSLADKMFVWPNFVDPAVFHDYGLPKVIPVMFTGSQATHYPWRNSINRVLSQNYPSLQSPHFGWSSVKSTARMISGAAYARMLNAAVFVPTCGTIANEIVRKHFEIPACNACLITQRTEALEAAGFQDRMNCLFVDETDVLDKVDWLFQNPEERQRISQAGHDLVQTRHTIQARDQIYQWFKLNQQLKPNQRIVQPGPFLPLTIVDRDSGIWNGYVQTRAVDRVALEQGDKLLWAGQYDEAAPLFRAALNYHNIMPEPKVLLALCSLFQGDAKSAADSLWRLMQRVHAGFATVDPDPVEWAYYIVALLGQGKTGEAVIRARQFESLRHLELDRVRAVVRCLSGQSRVFDPTPPAAGWRDSIHQLPQRTMEVWLEDLHKMLKACGSKTLAQSLPTSIPETKAGSSGKILGDNPLPTVATAAGSLVEPPGMSGWDEFHTPADPAPKFLPVAPPPESFAWCKRQINRVKRRSLRTWKTIQQRRHPELPPVPENKELTTILRQMLSKEAIQSGLLMGATDGSSNTEAFLEGMNSNASKPSIVCANTTSPNFDQLKIRLAENTSVKCRSITSRTAWENLDAATYEVVFVDGSEINFELEPGSVQRARWVVLDDLNTSHIFKIGQTLLSDRNYLLSHHSPGSHGGYAVFKRLPGRG